MKKQIENRCKKFTATLLASLMIVGTPLFFPDKTKLNAAVDGDGTPEYNESYVNKTSLSGRAPAFNYETLMNWSPDKDPDAWINRSTEPLAPRFKGVQINPKAHPEARILNCGLALWSHDLASSTGSSDFEVYAFDNWQLIDTFVFWSGTDEGIFAIPSPDVITAAHKNGVKVHALLGFPWGGQPEGVAEMRRMYQQADDGSYPAGDKMIEIAYHFNFDGYFFNQESYGGNPDDTTKLAGLMRYIRDKSSKMGKLVEMSWYDAMANHGNVSHQNAVNGENDYWIKPQNSSNDYAVDQFFMNYNWGPSHINTTVNTMRANNRSPFDAYAGMEVQQNSYDTNVYTGGLLDNNGQPRVSIALFAPNSTMGKASSPETFHKEEEMFYTGPEGDPSLSADNSKWRGMARFVTDSSVIQGDNFHTSFNAGHGKNWFDKGTLIRQQTWNNRSIQDIMPTWRWWVRDVAGSRINVSYDFDDAWNGGNSLLFNGDLTANSYNNVMLYSTKLLGIYLSSRSGTLGG